MRRLFRRDEKILGDEAPSPRVATFAAIDSEAALDAVFDSAATEPLFLFLHDPYCPISSHAYEEVEKVGALVHLLDVSSHSTLGKKVERRTGIRHESPQAIVFRGGTAVWHASHGRIQTAALRAALGI